jgi:hypothetical protein
MALYIHIARQVRHKDRVLRIGVGLQALQYYVGIAKKSYFNIMFGFSNIKYMTMKNTTKYLSPKIIPKIVM